MLKIKNIFKYEPELVKNLKEYDKKEKAKQQKSKVQNKSRSTSNNKRD